ncbi:hypothetical protein ACLOJK_001497 [Asimina triloba]
MRAVPQLASARATTSRSDYHIIFQVPPQEKAFSPSHAQASASAMSLASVGRKKMPGLRAPRDYSEEPPRHPSLKINAKEPFNAEPPRSALIASYVTPVDMFYKRNHGPIPIVDDIERQYLALLSSRYRVSINGSVENPIQLSMAEIRKLPKYNVTATLQCAGNRRTAMSIMKTVKGVGWDVAAIGNGCANKHATPYFLPSCQEENGGPYKASIPLSQATNPDADVLLAYEMNGEVLNRDHGYPLRVIVPGVIGARSVKWLEDISITAEECQGFFMQKDYKMFPPSIDWDNIDWSTRRPQMDFPVQSIFIPNLWS